MACVQPFNKLVKLAARAFYSDVTAKTADNNTTSSNNTDHNNTHNNDTNHSNNGGIRDNRGIVVVVVEALSRRKWIMEDELAGKLSLNPKQVRRVVKFLEEERFLNRDHKKVKEVIKGKGGEEKVKQRIQSYCCLDYAQIFDVVRYRLYHMKKQLKDELEDKCSIREYVCPNCRRKYNALDALRLVSIDSDAFHCENCQEELVTDGESDILATAQAANHNGGGGDYIGTRRWRNEKFRQMVQKMEAQLKPLEDQVKLLKEVPVPEFVNLRAWEATRAAAQTEVQFESSDEGNMNGVEVPRTGIGHKVMPPWMIRQEMNLVGAQGREGNQESKMDMDGNAGGSFFSDDKKSSANGEKKIDVQQAEYAKAYYAALLQRQGEVAEQAYKRKQQELMHAPTPVSNGYHPRQVGMKSKREEETDDNGDDFEWEDGSVRGGNADEASGNDGSDVEWEDG